MPVLQADRLLHRALLGIFAICQHANGWGGHPAPSHASIWSAR